ncbi:MAG: hypothetical protein WDW36_008066 [Sanguina aurantia]
MDSGTEASQDAALSAGGRFKQQVSTSWAAFPSRSKLAVASHLAFAISNMDKVVFMVAILPMSREFGWSPSISGVVQASFFMGFLLMQIPGGGLSSVLGGRRVLPVGLTVWSAATALIPLAAASLPTLCLARAMVGAGQAVAPSSVMDVIARSVPKEERSTATAFAFAGLHVGSAIALLVAPFVIEAFGWRALFGVFGGAGLVWLVLYELLIDNIAQAEPELARSLSNQYSQRRPVLPSSTLRAPTSNPSSSSPLSFSAFLEVERPRPYASTSYTKPPPSLAHRSSGGGAAPIPYRAFLRCPAVRALMVTHFCNNWFHYTMLAWLPTYFVDTMNVDLLHASQTALLPPLAGIVASAIAGPLADRLIGRGVDVAVVRKMAQGLAFLAPALGLLLASTTDDTQVSVAAITLSLGVSSFSLAGLYCTHQDMSPKYASALLGVTNTAGSVPGIVGVTTVGMIFQATHSWEQALFAPCTAFLALGMLAYSFGSRHEPIDFDAADNSPFAFEVALQDARAAVAGSLGQAGSRVRDAGAGWLSRLGGGQERQ